MSKRSSIAQLDHVDSFAGFAPLAIRVFLGGFLVFLSQDNVFSGDRMAEFEKFLAGNGFPMVAVAARVSVYAQFVCGILIVVGAFTRWAALLMIVNFVVAIVGVHLNLPFRTLLEPAAMLASSIALFLGGAGRLSIDAWRSR